MENIIPHPLHSVPIPRVSKRTLGPIGLLLPLPDARMGRSSSMQISDRTKVSIHPILSHVLLEYENKKLTAAGRICKIGPPARKRHRLFGECLSDGSFAASEPSNYGFRRW